MFNPKKSPYQGQIAVMLALAFPSAFFTLIFYGVISMWQGRFGVTLNWASAKAFGCGIGVVFHLCCSIMGTFKEHRVIVKERVKEFFSDLSISPKTAFKWYFDDLKTNGIAYWIDLLIIGINIWIFVNAVLDFIAIRGLNFLNW